MTETTKETSEFTFTPTGEPNQLWVLSRASGETYRVDLKDFVCSCADFKFRHAKGDRMCKHLKAASEAYDIQPPETRLPAIREGQAITISQEEIMKELTTELRDEMVRNYVYAVPDYEREWTDKQGKKRTTKKAGWIDLKAIGVRDLAHMVADRYGTINVGEFRFMDVGDKWIAWRDINLGNFTTTGFAECSKDREFPFRYLGEVVMRNSYKAIVPRIYQDIFTNKFKELMRRELGALLGAGGEAKLGKPILELTDGELAKHLKEAQESKTRRQGGKVGAVAPTKAKPSNWDDFLVRAKQMGLSEDSVYEILGVTSEKEWTDQGKTIDDAVTVISEELAKPKTAPLAEQEVRIDLQWLKEAKQTLKWTDETMKTFLVSKYKVSPQGTLTEVLNRLTTEQAEDFTREINSRVEKQASLF